MAKFAGATAVGLALALFAAASGRHSAMLPAKGEAGRDKLISGARDSTAGALATAVALTCLGAFAGPIAAGILGGKPAAIATAVSYGFFELAASRKVPAFVPSSWHWGGMAAALACAAAGAALVSAGLAAQARQLQAALEDSP